MKSKFNSEAALAAALIQALEQDERKDIFAEVQIERGGHRADIVVLLDGIVTVIETKLSATLDAVIQAKKWNEDAHFVAVAVPYISSHEKREAYIEICETAGVGLMFVGEHVTIPVKGTFNRIASSRLTDHLLEHGDEYKSKRYAKAGTKDGGHFTECNKVDRALIEYVEQNPGVRLAHAVSAIEHKFGSNAKARNYYSGRIRLGHMKALCGKREHGDVVLYPATQGAKA